MGVRSREMGWLCRADNVLFFLSWKDTQLVSSPRHSLRCVCVSRSPLSFIRKIS